MTLDTNLNSPPYYDDFDANNNFYRVLFRPSVAVQARELTQMQTIQQDQIEKFGKHIFKDGSIIEGCTISFDSKYNFVKVQDNYSNGSAFTISDFIGKKVVASSNLQAYIMNTVSGFEADAPDTNTLYIKYLNTGTYGNGDPQKVFDSNELLEIRVISSDINFGNVYTTISDSTGFGYATSISEGTVFQKGFFIRVEPQTVVVSKYSNLPDNLSVGFKTTESIVTADIDGSLNDNAQGAPNYNAPGANRLKLTANLVVRTTDDTTIDEVSANTDNFFSIADFENGVPVRVRTDAQYAALGREMARRTFEESGNYIVDPFELYTVANTTDTQSIVVEVGGGLGYVEGYRTEFLDKRKKNIRKGTDVAYYNDQIISSNYGNYVIVDEFAGQFDFEKVRTVSLRSVAGNRVTSNDYGSTPAAPGSEVGTAQVRQILYYSGVPGTPTAQYRMFLFNIQMGSTYNFKDVRSIYVNDPVTSVKGYADLVLEGGNAVLKEPSGTSLVYPLGKRASRNLLDESNNNDTAFYFRKQQTLSFTQANGTSVLTLSAGHAGGNEGIAPTGSLSESNELQFLVIANTNSRSTNVGGSVETFGNTLVTGTSTSFLTDFRNGDHIYIANVTVNDTYLIANVDSDTTITLASSAATFPAGANCAIAYPIGGVISFTRDDTANVVVAGDGSTATFTLSRPLDTALDGVAYFPVYRSTAVGTAKDVNKNRFVKIQANTNVANSVGPWCLGLPDVYKIRGVYQGTTYANTNTDQKAYFELDSGQRDGFYNLSYLKIKPGSGHTVGTDDRLLVELDHFVEDTGSGIGFFSVSSYPIDDANTANTTAITTQEIPVYKSTTTGAFYDLRDCIDFRPVAANTANSATTIANATEDPAATLTFSTANQHGAHTIAPDTNFSTNFSYYLGRKDKIAISTDGKIINIEGAPDVQPRAPRDRNGTMTLGTLNIPPYPSLSQDDVRTYKRPDYAVTATLQQNRRYTMRDIGILDKKIDRLEYYTSLSLLEASAKTLIIKDDAGADRFKNGFLVEPFKGFGIADTKSAEFKGAIDIKVQELAPTIERNYVDLKYNSGSSSNMTQNNSLIMLDYNANTIYLSQPFASKYRNPVGDITYTWRGSIKLAPEGDNQPDVYHNPDVIASIDLQNITDFINGLPNIIGTERIVGTSTQSSTSTSTDTTAVSGGTLNTTTSITAQTTTTTTLRNDIDYSATTAENSFSFGEVVQDVSIQEYIRPKRIQFFAKGMRPNTRVYPFFDDTSISQYCTPIPSGGKFKGDPLTTDSNGDVSGHFDIPQGMFKTGERIFKLADVDNLLTGSDSITTLSIAIYHASNIAITKANLGLQTRIPQISSTTVRVVNTSIDSSITGISVSSTFTATPVVTFAATPVVDSGWSFGGEGGGGGGEGDPIAQTFMINEPYGIAGIYLTKADLFFYAKDSAFGCELQIRETVNGVPGPGIMPFGSVILASASINTSSDASIATTFTFDSPIFLENGKEYCLVVKPIGNNINYRIWVAEQGGTDIYTQSPIYDNSGIGVMFTSSTNRAWTPFQKEDIKFTLYRANFSSTTGTAVYNNGDVEYLTANNFKNDFYIGEKIYISNGIVTTTDVTVNQSNTVSNTGIHTQYNVGDMIYITANDGLITNVLRVTANGTTDQISVDSNVSFNDSAATAGKLAANGGLYGYLSLNNENEGLVYLSNSSAIGTNTFSQGHLSANGLLIGEESKARANLVSVDSVHYSVVIPQFSHVAPRGTTIAFNMKGLSNSTVLDTSSTPVQTDIETYFTDKERKVMSRSLEIDSYSGNKSLVVSVPVTTENSKVSPILDDIKSDILVIKNIISNNSVSTGEEDSDGGDATAKYVSKRVVLANGQDAEDLRVYVSAYKPSGTDIYVYCKLLNAEDSEPIDDKSWTLMTQETDSTQVSSRVDRNDYQEFIYVLPTGTNATVSTTAFLNSDNGGISRYYNNANAVFDSYKSFSIKIVMTSEAGSHLVPRVSDMRAIALQA